MQRETHRKVTTYHDPSLVVENVGGLVNVGMKRVFQINTDNDGIKDVTHGEQWLKFGTANKWDWTTGTDKVYLFTVPSDAWSAVETFLLALKSERA